MTTAPEVEALREQWSRLLAFTQDLAPADLNKRTPCRGWRVRDVIAHSASLSVPLAALLDAVHRGKPTTEFAYDPHVQSQRNQEGVSSHRNRPDLLAFHRLRATSTLTLFDLLAQQGKLEAQVEYMVSASVRTLASMIAVDLAVHLWDISSAVGKPLMPDIAILEGAMPALMEGALPALFEPQHARKLSATYAVTLSDVWNGTWHFVIDDGMIVVERGTANRAQVHLTADTATFLLLYFGRITTVGSVLRGRLHVRGNPQTARRFLRLFVQF